MNIVCTGRGSHRAITIRTFAHAPAVGHTNYTGWCEVEGKITRPLLEDTYTFACRRCQCQKRLKARNLRRALDGLDAADEVTLDISQLPF